MTLGCVKGEREKTGGGSRLTGAVHPPAEITDWCCGACDGRARREAVHVSDGQNSSNNWSWGGWNSAPVLAPKRHIHYSGGGVSVRALKKKADCFTVGLTCTFYTLPRKHEVTRRRSIIPRRWQSTFHPAATHVLPGLPPLNKLCCNNLLAPHIGGWVQQSILITSLPGLARTICNPRVLPSLN